MIRISVLLLGMAFFGVVKLPVEHTISANHRALRLRATPFSLQVRDQLGQLGFVAALGGFRSFIADALFIQAHVAWERTQWGRVLFLFRQVTTLQPRSVLFWDMAAWHMAWNASTAALNDSAQPSLALRIKAQREYLQLGKDFLELGIQNNPDRPELYEAMARLYRDKYGDHERASEFFEKAATLPGARSYLKRFAAYELAKCEGHDRAAYERLRSLYAIGENERLPTLVRLLKKLEIKLAIPAEERIADANAK